MTNNVDIYIGLFQRDQQNTFVFSKDSKDNNNLILKLTSSKSVTLKQVSKHCFECGETNIKVEFLVSYKGAVHSAKIIINADSFIAKRITPAIDETKGIATELKYLLIALLFTGVLVLTAFSFKGIAINMCEKGSSIACQFAGMISLSSGKKTEALKSFNKDFEINYSKQIEKNSDSCYKIFKERPCFNLAQYYEEINFLEKAHELYEIGCKKNLALFCNAKFKLYVREGKVGDSIVFISKACANNMAFACILIAKEKIKSRQYKEAFLLTKKICTTQKHGEACHMSADYLLSQDKLKEAQLFYQKACSNYYKKACAMVNRLFN